MNLGNPKPLMETNHSTNSLWHMHGYAWIVQILREQIIQGTTRHAYLLTGPQGVGRRTLAVRMAQALNCVNPTSPGEPCFKCRSCKLIERTQHPDVLVIQSEAIGSKLKVEQIRDLQRSLSLAPYEAQYRVAILLRFEEANPNAANALLKTLEEPPPQVKLILTAESSESVLPTIVSRCEVIRLHPLPVASVNESLQSHWGLSPDQALLLAHLSGGCLGSAVRFYQEPERLSLRQEWLEDHMRLLTSSRVERFAYAENLTKDKDKKKAVIRPLLEVWLSFWRDVFLLAAGTQNPLVNQDRVAEIDNLAARLGMENSHRMVVNLEHTIGWLDKNVNPRLALEVLMLNLPVLIIST